MDINKYNVSDLLLHFVEGDEEEVDIPIRSKFILFLSTILF